MSQARQLPWLIYLTAMAMELCCLYLWLALLRQHLEFGFLVFALILALYPLSFFVRLVVARSPGTAGRSRLFTAVLAATMVSAVAGLAIWQALTASYAMAGVIFQIIFSGVSWWLGNTLVRAELNYHYLCFRFQGGILAMLAVLLFGGVETTTFLPVALFFTMATFCLALARWETSRSGSLGTLRPLPLLSMVLGSAAVLLPSFLLFFALSPDVVRTMLHWLARVAINFMNLLGLNRLPQASGKPVEIGLASCSCGPANEGAALPQTPPPSEGTPIQISPVFLWIGVIVVFLGIILVILRTVRKIRAQRQAQSAEMANVETVLIPASLFGQLTALLKKIVKGLWHWWQSVLRRAWFIRPGRLPVPEPVVSVRALYRGLLKWGARQGLPRALSQTPLEYLKVLCQSFPHEDTELSLITRAYLQARYSASSPASEEFAAAERAWQQVKLAPQPHLSRGH